jgi:hypothetical protein
MQTDFLTDILLQLTTREFRNQNFVLKGIDSQSEKVFGKGDELTSDASNH